MAADIGATAAYRTLQMLMTDLSGGRYKKIFNINANDAVATDVAIEAFLNALNGLSNCGITRVRLDKRPITGLSSTPMDLPYQHVSDAAILWFNQVSPLNPDVTLWKAFAIPAAIDAIFLSDNKTLITPNGAGTADEQALNTIVTFLQTNLVSVIRSAGQVVTGSWVYQPDYSGFEGLPYNFHG